MTHEHDLLTEISRAVAAEQVKKVMAEHHPSPLSAATEEALRRMRMDFESHKS